MEPRFRAWDVGMSYANGMEEENPIVLQTTMGCLEELSVIVVPNVFEHPD